MLLKKNQFTTENINQCAELYCQIWKEPPWNEDFWKTEEIIKDMYCQFSKKNSEAVMFLKNHKVIGFSWGYEVSKEELGQISGGKNLDNLFNGKGVFYIDELAISSEFRNQKIGETITRALLNLANLNSMGIITLRTELLAISARKVYVKLGFKELKILDEKYPTRSYWKLEL